MNRKPWKLIIKKITSVIALALPERVKVNLLQAIPFWTASLVVGFVAVVYTKLFGYAEHLLQLLLQWQSWSVFIATPLCFLAAWVLVQKAAPTARGSGIPQVMAALELATPRHEKRLGSLLSLRILITKIISSFIMVLGGGAIGREGPTIQIAGSIFYVMHRLIPASWPKLSNQAFILTGAAGGLAAAFNTPLGGVVFAIEELAKIHVRYFRTALFSAVIIAGLTAQALLGPYLYLGFPKVGGGGFYVFLGVTASAVIAGVLGSLMCKGILRMMQWKRSFSQGKTVVYILLSGLAIATLSYFLNGAVLGSGKELMNEALFTDKKAVSWHTMLLRIIGPMIAFNTGAAGGIFAPSLAAGASVGGFISGLFSEGGAHANVLILCGMVGFLTGVTRTPFTSAILVLEMTDRHSVIFYLMLAALVSNIAALLVDKHSFYEQLKKGYVQEAIMKDTGSETKKTPAAED